jgi:hypothetical protein
VPRFQLGVLAQVADGQVLFSNGKSGVAFQLVGNELEQRALAAAIRPDQPYHAVVVDFPREIFKYGFRNISYGYTVKVHSNHDFSPIKQKQPWAGAPRLSNPILVYVNLKQAHYDMERLPLRKPYGTDSSFGLGMDCGETPFNLQNKSMGIIPQQGGLVKM